jgi:tetratricopeptide (TPR) repeat protein
MNFDSILSCICFSDTDSLTHNRNQANDNNNNYNNEKSNSNSDHSTEESEYDDTSYTEKKNEEKASNVPTSDQIRTQLLAMHYNLGCSLQEEGKLEEAILCYRNAVSIDKNHSDAQYNLANALQLVNKTDEAIDEYKKALNLNPKNNFAYYNLGYIYFNNKKDPLQGIEYFKKCLEIEPNDIDTQVNMALAYNDLGQLDDVINCYKAIISKDNTSAIAHFNLGNAYLDAGRLDDALMSFQVHHIILYNR